MHSSAAECAVASLVHVFWPPTLGSPLAWPHLRRKGGTRL